MELRFTNVSDEVQFAIGECCKELGFICTENGTQVVLGKCSEGVHIYGGTEGSWGLTPSRRRRTSHFMRRYPPFSKRKPFAAAHMPNDRSPGSGCMPR